jgi:hypothetical protein
MMKPDLIQEMLRNVGTEMYLIDTIDKVGRWEIELFGFDDPPLLDIEQAHYACENALQWQSGLTTEDITYPDSIKSASVSGQRILTGSLSLGAGSMKIPA